MRCFRSKKGAIRLCAALIAVLITGTDAATLRNVAFSDYSPLSTNQELAHRMLSPLTAASLPAILAGSGSRLAEQPVDLSRERFTVYVPSTAAPSRGYGLIVFVPPWNAEKIPDGWESVLDEKGLLFVSADNSGNDASALGRREPLALIAAYNVMKKYPVDLGRVYISGFSGGSRIAMRLALGYPDVFRGAILNSGGDLIGNHIIPLPPRDLMLRFQEASRLIYLTGEEDTFVLNAAHASMRSMREWCQFHAEGRTLVSRGHETIDAESLAWALDALNSPSENDLAQLGDCRAQIDRDMSSALKKVRGLMTMGQAEQARNLLNDIDTRYGGLAAPDSLELSRSLGGR